MLHIDTRVLEQAVHETDELEDELVLLHVVAVLEYDRIRASPLAAERQKEWLLGGLVHDRRFWTRTSTKTSKKNTVKKTKIGEKKEGEGQGKGNDRTRNDANNTNARVEH